MKAAVVGSRHYDNYKEVKRVLDTYPNIEMIISGGAKGVDSLADKYAREHGITFMMFPAEWDKYGKAAGPIRNEQIVNEADMVIAFLAPDSRGTKSTINIAFKAGKKVEIYLIGENGKLE